MREVSGSFGPFVFFVYEIRHTCNARFVMVEK